MKMLMILVSLVSFNLLAAITMQEVVETQEKWGDGIVEIGNVFQNNGDYRQAAADHINAMYDYQQGEVLFKPTLAYLTPFRPSFEGALSYFVGGNSRYTEDSGFAIKPWTNVRFDNHKVIFNGDQAIAMGHYYFTDLTGVETKVEYTLGFIKRGDVIKINLQDSSLPYNP